ncbi:MAG: AraC family transcriptional regulator [Catenulispora sp.]
MDILTDTLAAMRTGPPVAVRTDARGPWGLRFRQVAGSGFHVVLRGSCLLVPSDDSDSLVGQQPIRLEAGDLVLLRTGRGHLLTDNPDSPVVEFEPDAVDRSAYIGRISVGGTGEPVRLLCGAYVMDNARRQPLLNDVPDIFLMPADRWRHGGLRATIDLLRAEVEDPRPGSDGIVPALIDAMLLYILRAWFDEHSAEGGGWATALADPVMGRALHAIHEDPAYPWTVQALAAHANLSRAAFARRFRTLIGEPPLSYLTRWRLTVAARQLRDTDATLGRIARDVGYATEFAFARAFKREYGCSPGSYRRTMRREAAGGGGAEAEAELLAAELPETELPEPGTAGERQDVDAWTGVTTRSVALSAERVREPAGLGAGR